ncbi:MAG: carboxypeptidase-like regulatory domain-containing protein [Prevotellaceae bacterium]|jgi:hypothetical protein|nr:carboxypeptidase-like regulatory domain-containing protein [Prevotellaceae bacterium]
MKPPACLLLVLLLLTSRATLQAQEPAADYFTATGVVLGKENRKPLENVTVSLWGTNIGTVTNADGLFSLKIPRQTPSPRLVCSHLRYLNSSLAVSARNDADRLTIWMLPAPANVLKEVVVYGDARRLVDEAVAKIADNYADQPNLSTAFYRETIQKRKRYISISEAVMEVYKTSYENRTVGRDRVQVERGRRLLSPKKGDTLAIKLSGGPTVPTYMDLAKNAEVLLHPDELNHYHFEMETSVNLDNRIQYVVSFRPRANPPYPLYRGKLYIDYERLSFTRAEFEMDVSNRVKATEAILYKKPLGLRFRPQEVAYIITYKEQAGKSYLNYIRNILRFKCDWQKRLFSSPYTVVTEMVTTDRTLGQVTRIPYKEAFKTKDVFVDKVDRYWQEDFWKAYNIIEPTQSLENAVDKLRKQAD